MIGYKGIEVINGILRSKSNEGFADIFELGVPKERVEVDDGIAFTETGYSFCETIEYVLPWENYFRPINIPGFFGSRLFRVDTLDGKVVGTSNHYKSEKIVILEEVQKDEIVEYFSNNPNRLPNNYKDSYESFKCMQWKPYEENPDSKAINKTLVENCLRRWQKSICIQRGRHEDVNRCKGCQGYKWMGGVGEYRSDLWYLEARRKIRLNQNIQDISEYRLLEKKSKYVECRSLKLLADTIKLSESRY